MHKSSDLQSKVRELYQEHFDCVYQFLVYFTGTQDEAEDLTQEVFMQLLKSLPTYKGDAQMKTWILSIAKHLAIDSYRRKRRIAFLPDRFLSILRSNEKTPDQALDLKEEYRLFQQSLQKLKPNYRTVVILRAINELSIRETANILNCTESKVKVTYHRALELLRKEISLQEQMTKERWGVK